MIVEANETKAVESLSGEDASVVRDVLMKAAIADVRVAVCHRVDGDLTAARR
jgi:hypothetical protein